MGADGETITDKGALFLSLCMLKSTIMGVCAKRRTYDDFEYNHGPQSKRFMSEQMAERFYRLCLDDNVSDSKMNDVRFNDYQPFEVNQKPKNPIQQLPQVINRPIPQEDENAIIPRALLPAEYNQQAIVVYRSPQEIVNEVIRKSRSGRQDSTHSFETRRQPKIEEIDEDDDEVMMDCS